MSTGQGSIEETVFHVSRVHNNERRYPCVHDVLHTSIEQDRSPEAIS